MGVCSPLWACDNERMKTTTLLTRFGAGIAFSLIAFALPAAAFAATVNVSMTSSDTFSPQSITINAGDTVNWHNDTGMTHTVTSDTGAFDSGSVTPGQTFSATFNNAGTYGYHCTIHGSPGSGMYGTITVLAANQPASQGGNTNSNSNSNFFSTATIGTASGASTGSGTLTSTSIGTAAPTAAQAQALLAQVQTLQQQIGAAGGASATAGTAATGGGIGSCPDIGRILSPGSSGDDVSRLQAYLARDPSVYPEGLVTGYYGSLTEAAVERWQVKYNIVSTGTPGTTGFGQVGPRTAAAIALLCAQQSSGSTGTGTGTAGGAPIVSGYIQVTPIAGNAPLAVTVTATINVAGSCAGALYSLNFGDGTAPQQLQATQGNCSQAAQTIAHVYQYGGTYQITLSSGSHSTSATVTVSGATAPGTTTTTGTTGTPTGSISAFITSGPAPLSTTFYVSCASGLAYDVVFGDGQELGGSGVAQSTCNGSLQAIPHTYTSAGTYTAQLIAFVQSQGSINPKTIGSTTVTVGSGTTSGGTTSGTYAAPTLTPNVGGNPLAVSLQFTAGVCSYAYNIAWGDTGVSQGPAVDSQSGCSTTQTQSDTVSHTYTAAGSYTITLTRGSQTNTLAVTISN
jgi:plastocyanin